MGVLHAEPDADAGVDAEPDVDGGVDVAPDADAGVDAEPDADTGVDAESDADVTADITADLDADSGADAVPDVPPLLPDFRVQRGWAVLSSDSLTLTAGDDYDVPDGPAFVRLANTRLSGMGRTAGGRRKQSDRWMTWISDASDLTSAFTLQRYKDNDDCRVSWEIVEYVGSSDGPNAIAVIDRGVLQFGSDELVAANGASYDPLDSDDVVVFVTGLGNEAGGHGSTNTGLATAALVGSEAVFNRAELDDKAAQVSYAVVEFTGSNWDVQRIEHPIATPGSVESVAIAAVGDMATAFTHTQTRTTSGLVDELGAEVWLASPTALSVLATSTSIADITIVTWIVRNTGATGRSMTVRRYSGARSAGARRRCLARSGDPRRCRRSCLDHG